MAIIWRSFSSYKGHFETIRVRELVKSTQVRPNQLHHWPIDRSIDPAERSQTKNVVKKCWPSTSTTHTQQRKGGSCLVPSVSKEEHQINKWHTSTCMHLPVGNTYVHLAVRAKRKKWASRRCIPGPCCQSIWWIPWWLVVGIRTVAMSVCCLWSCMSCTVVELLE